MSENSSKDNNSVDGTQNTLNQAGRDIHINNSTHSQTTRQRPSHIATVIEALTKEDFSFENVTNNHLPASVNEKLLFNQLSHARSILSEYKNELNNLEKTYKTIADDKPNIKELILRKVESIYHSVLQKYDLLDKNRDQIIEKSDQIFFEGINVLKENALQTASEDICEEEIDYAVKIIFANAFTECFYLENPTKYNQGHNNDC